MMGVPHRSRVRPTTSGFARERLDEQEQPHSIKKRYLSGGFPRGHRRGRRIRGVNVVQLVSSDVVNLPHARSGR